METTLQTRRKDQIKCTIEKMSWIPIYDFPLNLIFTSLKGHGEKKSSFVALFPFDKKFIDNGKDIGPNRGLGILLYRVELEHEKDK